MKNEPDMTFDLFPIPVHTTGKGRCFQLLNHLGVFPHQAGFPRLDTGWIYADMHPDARIFPTVSTGFPTENSLILRRKTHFCGKLPVERRVHKWFSTVKLDVEKRVADVEKLRQKCEKGMGDVAEL